MLQRGTEERVRERAFFVKNMSTQHFPLKPTGNHFIKLILNATPSLYNTCIQVYKYDPCDKPYATVKPIQTSRTSWEFQISMFSQCIVCFIIASPYVPPYGSCVCLQMVSNKWHSTRPAISAVTPTCNSTTMVLLEVVPLPRQLLNMTGKSHGDPVLNPKCCHSANYVSSLPEDVMVKVIWFVQRA